MFDACTGLTKAPTLPATTLAERCYGDMFYGCTGLTEAPALPATTLEKNSYCNMFYRCTGLTKTPALPATTLAEGCYAYMFSNCTGLIEASKLPATTLVHECYKGMFYDCTNLRSITCLAADRQASNSTDDWLKGIAPEGTFFKNPSMKDWPTGANGIPENWTVENYDPTGIGTTTAAKAKGGKAFNLRGMKTTGGKRELRIVNGKKMMPIPQSQGTRAEQ